MTRRSILRRRRLPRAALALPLLSIPAVGASLAYAATAHTASTTQTTIAAHIKQRRIPYGRDLTVTGQAPSGEQGQTVRLEFHRAGGSGWGLLDSTRIGRGDRFRFHTQLRFSGAVRVTGTWHHTTRPGTSNAPLTTTPSAHTTSTHAASGTHQVTVVAVLRVRRHTNRDLGDHRITVHGTILPQARGREIRLEALRNGHWHTAAAARTGRSGRFALNLTPHASFERLRVRFGGDRSNGASTRGAGSIAVYSQSVASWYDDGGSTACGFHAYYGVANLSLPCGTKVTFLYGGRSVTATVDDRGPYVGGREWDLNQNTAGALGFNGVADVWASR